MIPAAPGFQPDRPGQPGFQRAQDLGYQTQGLAAVADLHIVVELSTVTRGPRPSVPPGGGGIRRAVRTLPMRWRVETDLEIVVTLDAPTRFRDYIREVVLPDDDEVLALLLATTGVSLPDDEEVLLLLAAPAPRPAPRPALSRAMLAAIVDEDDALVARLDAQER